MFAWDHQIVVLKPEVMKKMLRERSLINSIFFGTQVFFVVQEGTYVANMLTRSKQMVNPAITQLSFPKLQVTNLLIGFSSCILYLWLQLEVIRKFRHFLYIKKLRSAVLLNKAQTGPALQKCCEILIFFLKIPFKFALVRTVKMFACCYSWFCIGLCWDVDQCCIGWLVIIWWSGVYIFEHA